MDHRFDIFDIFTDDRNFRQIMKRLLEDSITFSFNGIMITEAGPGFPVCYVNPAFSEITGYGPHEIIGKSPTILQGPNTDPEVLARLRRQIESGDVFHGQAINYRKDGTEFMMEWKIVPIRNADQEITHYLAIQRDVTMSQG
jgi:PAS domain S-box-containing protein